MKLQSQLPAGRYIILDIGADGTKILDVRIRDSHYRIFTAASFVDMSNFVQAQKLVNIAEYTASIAAFLQQCKITGKNILIASGILGIQSTVKDITAEKPRVIAATVAGEQAQQLGRNYSFQVYGEEIVSNSKRTKVTASECDSKIIDAIIRGFKNLGYKVSAIENSRTVLYNLSKMYSSTYDIDGKIYIDFGHSTIVYTTFEGMPQNTTDFEIQNAEFVQDLAEKLKIVVHKVRQAIRTVGCESSSVGESKLKELGITNTKEYFEMFSEHIQRIASKITEITEEFHDRNGAHGETVVLCGGFCETAGFVDKLQQFTKINLEKFELSRVFENKNIKINNDTNATIGANYSACIGTMLKSTYKMSTNLISGNGMMLYADLSVNKFINLLYAIPMILIGFGLWSILTPGIPLLIYNTTPPKDIYSTASVKMLQSQLTQESTAVAAMGKTNQTIVPLMNFIAASESKQLKIASIDTNNELATTDGTASQANSPVTATAAPTSSQVSTEPDNLLTSSENTIVPTGYSALIIRGYATSTHEFTDFFNKLYSLQCIKGKATIKLAQNQTLPSNETILVFEIEVDVNE
jgi:Tfp pilus assembly PilM family ATPase